MQSEAGTADPVCLPHSEVCWLSSVQCHLFGFAAAITAAEQGPTAAKKTEISS